MSPSTTVRKLRDLALLPWRTTFSVVRALPRQVQRVGRSGDVTSAGADLLAASADPNSDANSELHRTGEGVFPIPNYDILTATDAAIAVQTLRTKTEVQAALRHERAGKNRKTVADAGERRINELAAAGR